MKQIGLAIIQYQQDNDEKFMSGTNLAAGAGTGVGWAGQTYTYAKSTQLYKCPDDPNDKIGYAFNSNLSGAGSCATSCPCGSLSALNAPASTVMLFEQCGDATTDVTNVTVNPEITSGAGDGIAANSAGVSKYDTGTMGRHSVAAANLD